MGDRLRYHQMLAAEHAYGYLEYLPLRGYIDGYYYAAHHPPEGQLPTVRFGRHDEPS